LGDAAASRRSDAVAARIQEERLRVFAIIACLVLFILVGGVCV